MWKFCVRAGPYTEQSLVGLDARAAGASILFRIPLLRELLLLANVRDASYDNIIGLLTSGRTVAVNPGGNWEMTSASHEQERIYVQQRLGFIRLAMRTGRPLLPAYAFGESQLFHASTRWLDQRLWMVEEVFERYVDEMCRLFREHAAACLPASVAARGLEVHRIGQGLVRHAKL
ncbi:diacylglycerol o-acyltransferase 2-like protein [Chrysochromulina tobinii]|uniref:diacylglycerol O-acyltransferase n=1 Tax=Chrysochromulina tobinii TaxID=1460289 RepID=A0A0M0JPN1_9EUKA|nr:diacylglycerol o-acyltransferase 2-like protein [Chrysochromulina tobinii]|eukprot:KOO28546.1 diacylglycerol o-acyltransferase 2-like protein [Chrysochromulina sp. CCMP291]